VGGIVERSSHSLDNSLSSGPLLSSTTKSFSAASMEGSIQNEKAEQSSLPPLAPRAPGSKKKCSGKADANGGTCASLGRCHCSKRRYLTQLTCCSGIISSDCSHNTECPNLFELCLTINDIYTTALHELKPITSRDVVETQDEDPLMMKSVGLSWKVGSSR
jgi:hypothetical protein